MHEEKIALVRRQIEALAAAVASRNIRHVWVVACGGSLATLDPFRYILTAETDKVSAAAVNAAEFAAELPKGLGEDCLVVLNSQSGTTAETVRAAQLAKERGALTAAYTTAPESPLEQAVDFPIYYYDAPVNPYPLLLSIFPEVYQTAVYDAGIRCEIPHAGAGGEAGIRLIERDMAVHADAAQKEGDAAVGGDLFFIAGALSLRIVRHAVENVDVFRLHVCEMVEKVVVHEVPVALVMLLGQAQILVHIERDHVGKGQLPRPVLPDKLLINADGRRAGGQAEDKGTVLPVRLDPGGDIVRRPLAHLPVILLNHYTHSVSLFLRRLPRHGMGSPVPLLPREKQTGRAVSTFIG